MSRYLIVFAILMCISESAFAQSACATLTDQDQMWYCRARAEHKSSYCASIRDNSLQRLCKAETGRPSECASIMDQQKRHFCEGVTGR